MVVHICKPCTWKAEAGDNCKLRSSLIFIVSSRLARAMQFYCFMHKTNTHITSAWFHRFRELQLFPIPYTLALHRVPLFWSCHIDEIHSHSQVVMQPIALKQKLTLQCTLAWEGLTTLLPTHPSEDISQSGVFLFSWALCLGGLICSCCFVVVCLFCFWNRVSFSSTNNPPVSHSQVIGLQMRAISYVPGLVLLSQQLFACQGDLQYLLCTVGDLTSCVAVCCVQWDLVTFSQPGQI